MKIAVVERYGGNTIANAFIKGFGLKKGAIASSIAHDSHNIIVIGYNSQMMADAVNQIIDDKGGIAVVSEDFSDSLPALLVIPSIKISDKGLFDGDNFEFMDVVIE